MLLEVIATAYCLTGRTFSGTEVKRGTVAVDPLVIPLGSRMKIPLYGRGRALDTGANIHGRIIDVWFPSCSAARKWGVKHLKIRVEK